jgi:metal-responsive CopG/Arc/MetJ family transcriptional regulator
LGRKRTDNIQFTVTLPRQCVEWLDKKVNSRFYYSRNHGIEVCMRNEMKKEELVQDE